MTLGVTLATCCGFGVFAFFGYRLGRKSVMSSLDGEIDKIKTQVTELSRQKEESKKKMDVIKAQYEKELLQIPLLQRQHDAKLRRYQEAALEKIEKELEKRTAWFEMQTQRDSLAQMAKLKEDLIQDVITMVEESYVKMSKADHHNHTNAMMRMLESEKLG